MHVVAKNADEVSHFFRPDVTHVCDSECVDVAKFSGVNRESETSGVIMQLVEVVLWSLWNQDCRNEMALEFFFYQHLEADFFESFDKNFPAFCKTFKTFFDSFNFCFDDCLTQGIDCLYRRSETCLFCFEEVFVLVVKIQVVVASGNHRNKS